MPQPGSLRAPSTLRLLRVLADGREHSTYQIAVGAQLCAVDTYVRQVRGHGWDVPRRREGSLHLYSLSTADLERLIALEAEIAKDTQGRLVAALHARRQPETTHA